MCLVVFKGLLYYIDFVYKSIFIKPCSSAGHINDLGRQENGKHSRRRCGISNTHLTGSNHHSPVITGLISHFNAHLNGFFCVFPGHCRFPGDVPCPPLYIFLDESFSIFKVFFHADVDNRYTGSGTSRKDIDCRPSGQEIFNH